MNTPIAENTGPPQQWPMKTITLARAGRNGAHYWLEIKGAEDPRWFVVIPTKGIIAMQGFVSMEDEKDGNSYPILSDPRDTESDPLEVEGVLYCPQAAQLILQMELGELEQPNGTPLPVPTEDDAKAWLANVEL